MRAGIFCYLYMFLKQLPHKNLIFSAILAIAIISIGFMLSPRAQIFSRESLATQDISHVELFGSATTTEYVDRDTDADGLPDWEEHLFSSDPLKFDSDGDGTPDGEEVRLGRDPSVPNTAPKGKVPTDILPSIQDPHFATSATDILGIKKEYFAKFLTAEGDKIRKDTFKGLIKSFDPKTVTSNYQLVDLNISSDNSPEALHAYGNAFGLLIKKYTDYAHRNEQEILKDGLKASSTKILAELQLPAIDYKNFSNDLKVLRVPSSLASSELKIVNGYAQMGKGLLAMQSLYSDPIVGAGGYQAYTIAKVGVTRGYAEIVVIFAKKNITFTLEEPGFPFYGHRINKQLPTGKTQSK